MLGLMSFLTAGKEVAHGPSPSAQKPPRPPASSTPTSNAVLIRAEIVSYDDLTRVGTYAAARDQGLLRLEGKDYVMQEGDIVNFRFNV